MSIPARIYERVVARPLPAPIFSLVLAFTACVLAGVARGAPAAVERDSIEREYHALLEAERKRHSDAYITERFSSGAAALAIGLYGYYSHAEEVLPRLIYSLTQTAGIVVMSDALFDAYQPSLMLLTDRYLSRGRDMNLERFKRAMVLVNRRRQHAERLQAAWTTAALASVYGYNGYREPKGSGVKDAMYFLSANFALISVVSFVRLWNHDSSTMTASVELEAFPYPQLTWRF